MKDDDLDLELDDEPVRPAPRPAPAATTAKGATVTGATASPAGRATPRKGFLSGITDSIAGMRNFTWNTRTFLLLLAVLFIIVIFAENWMPIRFYFFGFAFEIPKALSFIIDVALGAALMWLWLRRPGPGVEAGK